MNPTTGDTRQATEGGVWRSLVPYPEGKWVTNVQSECAPGKLVKLGTFQSTDFTLNPWGRKQTAPIPLQLKPGEFVSRVIMSGGFYDPRQPARHGAVRNGSPGLCVRSVHPGLLEVTPSGLVNPPFGNDGVPVGCVTNSRIVNMPAAYAVSATSAHPSIDISILDAAQTQISGPYTYGSHVVITTDFPSGPVNLLTYTEAPSQTVKPLAGTLSAWVCVDSGNANPGQ